MFLISSFLDLIFNKTPFDLRDKAILNFERDTADGIEIAGGSTDIQFAKNGTDWRIVTPVAVRADYAAVEELMTRLSSTGPRKPAPTSTREMRLDVYDCPSTS